MATPTSIERQLERAGHRVTAPRHALIAAIGGFGDHFTAEQLLARNPAVGRATVFRTLRLLQDTGVLCQVVLDDGSSGYRLTPGGHHHHLVCSQCGAVADFAACDLSFQLAELASRTGFDIAAHRLEVYGRCASCRGVAAPAVAR